MYFKVKFIFETLSILASFPDFFNSNFSTDFSTYSKPNSKVNFTFLSLG